MQRAESSPAVGFHTPHTFHYFISETAGECGSAGVWRFGINCYLKKYLVVIPIVLHDLFQRQLSLGLFLLLQNNHGLQIMLLQLLAHEVVVTNLEVLCELSYLKRQKVHPTEEMLVQ